MSRWLTVWRAAQLVGVSRGALQQRVRLGELTLSDGRVSTDELLALYPETNLADSGMLERVAQIKEEAFGRRVRERLLPSQEVLAQRIFSQTQELADVRRYLQRYHSLVVDIGRRVKLLRHQPAADGDLRELEHFIDRGLAQLLSC